METQHKLKMQNLFNAEFKKIKNGETSLFFARAGLTLQPDSSKRPTFIKRGISANIKTQYITDGFVLAVNGIPSVYVILTKNSVLSNDKAVLTNVKNLVKDTSFSRSKLSSIINNNLMAMATK